ncbi:metallophosphoesterase [Paraburkholderia dilworthii]|uniref:Metallophosphoesterase n=1 Tax=Paraburkholderia dilworthii TaxID=948106 RepID=A0ABW9DFV8_9BURK
MKLLWTTDLHLLNPGVLHSTGVDPEIRLRRCIDDMLSNHGDAKRLVITGDLIQLRNTAAYSVLANILTDVRMPVRLLVGNHDDRVALSEVFPDAQLHEGFLQDAEEVDGHQLIYLDTLADGKHSGQLSPQRLAWLDKTLASADGPALLFMHHPPANVGIPALDKLRLSDGDTELADILRRHRNRQPYLFCGHLHRNVSGIWRGTPYTVMTTPHLGFALRMEQQPLVKVDENPGYGVILCEKDGVVVHTQSLTKDAAV